MREEIKKIIEKSIENLKSKGELPSFKIPEILVEHPNEKIRGDYSSNIAFLISKAIEENPFKIAILLKTEIEKQKSLPSSATPKALQAGIIQEVETVGGFINFFIAEDHFRKQISIILKEKNKFGSSKIGKGQKVDVDFISANPTGPLTLGNGRGGFAGDVLAKVLEKSGYKVAREYYVNDIGEQIKKLGHSVIGDENAVYKGQYIDELRKIVRGKSPETVGEKAAKVVLDKMIKPSIKKMGIKFDIWFSEKSLYKNKEVEKVIKELSKKGLTYESEGATWFKSKRLGDDKDRVLIRKDGRKTYFASEIAYLKNKFKRGFSELFFFFGADHHGYIKRLEAAVKALGFKKENIHFILVQLARVFKKGKEVRMSKRAGTYFTIDELVDEVGVDIARFFFLTKGADTQFNFDMDLAKEKSKKNPVFKVQYAYARICSILKKVKAQKLKVKTTAQNAELLKEQSETELVKQLAMFPEVVEDTVKDYQVQRIPQYATKLADVFHRFYEECKVITKDKNLSEARLTLVLSVKIVLKNTLDLIGVSAPTKM